MHRAQRRGWQPLLDFVFIYTKKHHFLPYGSRRAEAPGAAGPQKPPLGACGCGAWERPRLLPGRAFGGSGTWRAAPRRPRRPLLPVGCCALLTFPGSSALRVAERYCTSGLGTRRGWRRGPGPGPGDGAPESLSEGRALGKRRPLCPAQARPCLRPSVPHARPLLMGGTQMVLFHIRTVSKCEGNWGTAG